LYESPVIVASFTVPLVLLVNTSFVTLDESVPTILPVSSTSGTLLSVIVTASPVTVNVCESPTSGLTPPSLELTLYVCPLRSLRDFVVVLRDISSPPNWSSTNDNLNPLPIVASILFTVTGTSHLQHSCIQHRTYY